MSAYFVLITPALIVASIGTAMVCWLLRMRRLNPTGRLIIAAVSALVALAPVAGGLSMAQVLLSINPVYSIGSMGGAAVLAWHMIGGRPFITRREATMSAYAVLAFWALLNVSYLGFTGPDIYRMGYGFSVWFAVVAAIAVALLSARSPVAFVLLGALAAYNMRLLGSDNLFDYLVDVPLAAGCMAYLVRSWLGRRKMARLNGYTLC